MSTPVRVAGFLAVLAAVFGAALGVGTAVAPIGTASAGHDAGPADGSTESDGHGDPGGHGGPAGHDGRDASTPPSSADIPGGLLTTQDGYTLALAHAQADPGRAVPVAFTVTGPDGEPVTAYDETHERDLHLIAVRRDLSGFQHVHPELTVDGTWRTRLDLTPGTWRLFADFTPAGATALTLGTDLAVAGQVRPSPPAAETRTATVDGYTVTLEGDLAPGADSELTLTVSRDGRPVTDLQPYLGAYGHLVALREGDLAYLHVHPDGHPGDGSTRPGPEVVFHTAVPSAGDYRLYLDFRHRGVVRTAEFALRSGEAPKTPSTGGSGHDSDHTH